MNSDAAPPAAPPAPPPGAPIGVLIVEDDPLLRADLGRSLAATPGLRVVGSAGTAREARKLLQGSPAPSVLLVDLGLPDGDGVDLIRVLGERAPEAKALVLSVFADEERVVRALAAGAQGYVLKDASPEEVTRAIRDVAAGLVPLSPRVARYLLRNFAPPAPSGHAAPARGGERLSTREAQLLTLISHGQTAPQIAQSLGLSLHTVYTHLRNCYAKLDAHNRLQAVRRAREGGQIG